MNASQELLNLDASFSDYYFTKNPGLHISNNLMTGLESEACAGMTTAKPSAQRPSWVNPTELLNFLDALGEGLRKLHRPFPERKYIAAGLISSGIFNEEEMDELEKNLGVNDSDRLGREIVIFGESNAGRMRSYLGVESDFQYMGHDWDPETFRDMEKGLESCKDKFVVFYCGSSLFYRAADPANRVRLISGHWTLAWRDHKHAQL